MKTSRSIAIAVAFIALTLPTGAAGSGGNEVRNQGTCDAGSTSKVKAKTDDGKLEVEFEVDQNKNGEKWKVKLKDNSDVVFRGTAITKAPSGSFSLERKIADKAGSDSIVAVGRNLDTGERCSAEATI
ncbi:MAG: hypothetical protein QOI31_2041 [Solirubrobacterales bacterium]|nr:hypothetical protein [Solirubrobacterales bacterium]